MTEYKRSYIIKKVKESIVSQLKKSTFYDNISPDKINMEIGLAELGLDSFSLVDLVVGLGKRFQRDDIYNKMLDKNYFNGNGLVEVISS
ncbi:hypothetical protein HN903_03300 [archaeon]|jgi:acyl carrier protein|nr:hypothetical protein [archaeon]MBT6955677.1 hypothetical protein [archaeon]MBT7128756.1 hypothetical protein [archaeon]